MFDAKKLLDAMMTASQASSRPGASAGPGGLGDVLGSVLGQLSGGQAAGPLQGKLKDLVANNQFAAGGALGSLAGLFLGSKAGRGLAIDAAKLGGLAVIGGLAYKAWQNYQQGKPPLSLPGSVQEPPAASPFGTTGDESADQSHAALLLRAMIAAASCDGVVDEAERARIVGGLKEAGLGAEAASFLDEAFASPASVDDLVAAASGPELAAEVYTAARLTIDPDTAEEQRFLSALAQGLRLQPELAAHIDAAAESAKVSA